jgi:hypothetical protein
MLRFVILHHTGYGDEHWDLMLENQGRLLTWKLPGSPGDGSALPIQAVRISDHRLLYLDYEGPVSGERGHVAREDTGGITWVGQGPEGFTFVLQGDRLSGRFELKRQRDIWIFDRGDA